MSENILRIIIVISTVLYGSAFVMSVIQRGRFKILRNIVWLCAAACSAVLVIYNFLANGYVPFVSIYQILTFSLLCFGIIYLCISLLRDGRWTAPYFSGCSFIISLGLCFMDINAVWHFPPALRSIWFVPHILMYIISYVLTAAAFSMTATKIFISEKSSLNKSTIDGGVYLCASASFTFMTIGMLFGAVWANEVWGDFWGWDIKECWALVSWLAWCIYLHIRRSEFFKRFSDAAVVISFVCVVITFFFVNGMTGAAESMHTYSMG